MDEELLFLEGYSDIEVIESEYGNIDNEFKGYYSKKKIIKSIDIQILLLERSNEDLQYSIDNTSFTVDTDLPSGNAGERVGGSNSTESYIEKKFIVGVERLEKRINDNNKKIFELKDMKNKIIIENLQITLFMGMSSNYHKDILYKKYVEEKTLLEIGIDLNCSEGTVRKHIKKIMKSYKDFKEMNKK